MIRILPENIPNIMPQEMLWIFVRNFNTVVRKNFSLAMKSVKTSVCFFHGYVIRVMEILNFVASAKWGNGFADGAGLYSPVAAVLLPPTSHLQLNLCTVSFL